MYPGSCMCAAFLSIGPMRREWWPQVTEMTGCHWSCGIDQSGPEVVGRWRVACSMWHDGDAGHKRARLPAACIGQRQQAEQVQMMNGFAVWVQSGLLVFILPSLMLKLVPLFLHSFMKRVLGEHILSAPTAVEPWSTILIKSRMLHEGHLLVDSWTASTFEPHTSSLRTFIFSKSIGVSAPVPLSSK